MPCGDKVHAFSANRLFFLRHMGKENCELPWNETKSYEVRVLRISETGHARKIDSPQAALTSWRCSIAKKRWFDEDKEHLVVLILSTRYKILGHSLVSIGSLNESLGHPREIFKAAVAGSAYAIILMHNHPSGDPAPSRSDHSLTKRMEECGELLGIRMLDHVIVGKGRLYFSFKEAEEAAAKKDAAKRRTKKK